MRTNTAIQQSVPPAGPSLVGTISSLCVDFRNMKVELQNALREVAALRREVSGLRSRQHKLSQLDVTALRRRMAFEHHPDRGGDPDLMTTLNAFLDTVESARQ